MLEKNKKLLIGGATGALVTGTALAIALPLTLSSNDNDNDKAKTPRQVVDMWKAKFTTDNLKIKDFVKNDTLPKVGEELTFAQLKTVLKKEFVGPTDKDGITIKMTVKTKDTTSITFDVTFESIKDKTVNDNIKGKKITGFVSEADITVRDQVTEAVVKRTVEDKLKTEFSGGLSAKTAAEAIALMASQAWSNKIDLTLSTNSTGTITVSLYDAKSASGKLNFKYKVVMDSKASNLNKDITRDSTNENIIEISGFKISDAVKAAEIQGKLDALSQPIKVAGVDTTPTPKNGDAIPAAVKTAFDGEVADITEVPTYVFVSEDSAIGQVTYKVTYTITTATASKDITFTGFQTTVDADKVKLEADVTAFKNAVTTPIAITGTPELNSISNNIASINAVLRTGGSSIQIPAAINGVSRSYDINKNIASGSASIEVTFSLNGETNTYTFNITGFKTAGDAITAEIAADAALLDGKSYAATQDAINNLVKDATPDAAAINTLLSSPIPTAINSVTRNYKVTSESNATTASIEVKISKPGGTAKTINFTITGLISQADFDAKNIDNKVNEKLEKTYVKSDKDATVGTIPGAAFDLTIGSTTFSVTVTEGAVDVNKGTIKYTFAATATGLNSPITAKAGILSGFKTNLTNAEKASAVQTELDAISSPVNSGMSGKAPADYAPADAKTLLDGKVSNKQGGTAVYTKGTATDGAVVITITYKFDDSNKATKDVTVNGLKSNEAINKEKNTKDVNDVSGGITGTSATIDDANGLAEVSAGTTLDATAAGKLGITLPTDIKGTTLTYSHLAIAANGNLEVVIIVKKGAGATKANTTKTLSINVTGIDAAKQKLSNTNDIKGVKDSDVETKLNLPKDKLVTTTKPNPITTDNGVVVTFSEWNHNQTNGSVTWKANLTKGSGTSKELPGTISGFAKLLADPTAGNITGVKADGDGTTLTGGTNPANTTITLGAISAGAKTVEVTVTTADGYSFAGDSKTKQVTGVAVDQTKYELAQAKNKALSEINTKYTGLTPTTLTGDAVEAGLATTWTGAKAAAEQLVTKSTTTAEVGTNKTKALTDIQSKFDAYNGAIINSNKVTKISNNLDTLTLTATSAIAAVSAETTFTEAVLNALGTIRGTFPDVAGATLTYTVPEIAAGASGDMSVKVTISDSSKTVTIAITVTPAAPAAAGGGAAGTSGTADAVTLY